MDDKLKFDRYYNLTLRFLSYRPRSEKEIVDYLRKKKISEEIVAKIMERLQEYKFIDDLEFTKFWIEQRTKIRRKPLRVIEMELKQKGIGRDLVDEILSHLKDRSTLDFENAKKLASKKLDFYRELDPKKRNEKVASYLMRKGFSYDTVKKILRV